VTITQASHGLSAGRAVYHNGTQWAYASAANYASADAVGIISAVTTDTFTLVTGGEITGLSGLTAGSTYYVASSVAADGTMSTTRPTNFSKKMLLGTSASTGFVLNAEMEDTSVEFEVGFTGIAPTSVSSLPAGFSSSISSNDVTITHNMGREIKSIIYSGYTASGTAYHTRFPTATSELTTLATTRTTEFKFRVTNSVVGGDSGSTARVIALF
jgi:hypothetical protein